MTPLVEAVISDVAKAMPHAALMACNPDDLTAIARAALAVVREKMPVVAWTHERGAIWRADNCPDWIKGSRGADEGWFPLYASPLGGDKP